MSNPFSNWTREDVRRHNEKVQTVKAKHFGGREDKGLHAPSRKMLVTRQGLTPALPKKRKPAYTEQQVRDWCKRFGLPEPVFEYLFHPKRKWRMDIAWFIHYHIPNKNATEITVVSRPGVFLEVQGGLWIRGGHSRGAGMKKDWEKWIAAQSLGWRVAWCEPKELLTEQTANIIKELMQ